MGVLRYKFEMLKVINLASGVDMKLFSMIFMSSILAVGVPTSPEWLILFPPTMRRVFLDYLFSGQKLYWSKSSNSKFDRLEDGCTGRVKVIDAIFFIHQQEVPQNRKKYATYVSFQYNFCPENK